jgi:hypothetical protein
MSELTKSLVVILLCKLAIISQGQYIVLDLGSDNNGLFQSNSCAFGDFPSYFEQQGCPLNPPASEILLESRYGFWTTCGTNSCDIIFDAGFLPSVKNMSFGIYFDGGVSLSTWGKVKGDEEEWQFLTQSTHSDAADPSFLTLTLSPINFHVSWYPKNNRMSLCFLLLLI